MTNEAVIFFLLGFLLLLNLATIGVIFLLYFKMDKKSKEALSFIDNQNKGIELVVESNESINKSMQILSDQIGEVDESMQNIKTDLKKNIQFFLKINKDNLWLT